MSKKWTLVFLVLAAAGCGASFQPTPVTPVPATAEETAEMKTKIQGRWQAKTIQDQGKPAEPFSGGTMVFDFGPAGDLGAIIDVEGTWLVMGADARTIDKKYTYSFEGKNMKTSFAYIPDARVESLTDSELTLFNYGMSQTLTFVKK